MTVKPYVILSPFMSWGEDFFYDNMFKKKDMMKKSS